ncbi:MAG TPA: tail fiber domain-containing protein [Candidatus Udaeobacter sp.]|nr:tail fiber domain-containing protein [Candidatus Udaeobacter sp.]
MKNQKIMFTSVRIALACFAVSSAALAAPRPSPTPARAGEDRGNNNSAAENVQALNLGTTGSDNTAHGWLSLFSNTSGGFNTADGSYALYNNTIGNYNMASGFGALGSNTTGSGNTAVGTQALPNNTSGNANIALGYGAGQYVTTGRYNIHIGSPGSVVDDHTIRVGQSQTATYIAGIREQTASGGVVVYVDIDGKLGTATSSARFKNQIKPMDKASEGILALKPVTFRYKKEIDSKGIPQFGLVAEEVEKVNSDLVVRDKEGKPYTVRYDAVNAMLLNEFLKEHKNVEQQQATIRRLKSNATKQDSTITELRKDMRVITAQLKEQAAQIQKVSAQVEMSKPATRVVANKP